MNAKVKIADLAPGASFSAGIVDLEVLEHFDNGRTLLVTKKAIGDRPFTRRPFDYKRPDDYAANDFAVSDLKEDLNGEFLKDLVAGGVISEDNIITTPWDLDDSEGVNKYGVALCKIAILSQTEVRKYYDAGLLDIDDWEWLRTPNAGNSYLARYVYPDGSLNHSNAYIGGNGVRPALIVESGTLVSIGEDQADLCDRVLLRDFTSKQLVDEVLRRIAAGEVDDGDNA